MATTWPRWTNGNLKAVYGHVQTVTKDGLVHKLTTLGSVNDLYGTVNTAEGFIRNAKDGSKIVRLTGYVQVAEKGPLISHLADGGHIALLRGEVDFMWDSYIRLVEPEGFVRMASSGSKIGALQGTARNITEGTIVSTIENGGKIEYLGEDATVDHIHSGIVVTADKSIIRYIHGGKATVYRIFNSFIHDVSGGGVVQYASNCVIVVSKGGEVQTGINCVIITRKKKFISNLLDDNSNSVIVERQPGKTLKVINGGEQC